MKGFFGDWTWCLKLVIKTLFSRRLERGQVVPLYEVYTFKNDSSNKLDIFISSSDVRLIVSTKETSKLQKNVSTLTRRTVIKDYKYKITYIDFANIYYTLSGMILIWRTATYSVWILMCSVTWLWNVMSYWGLYNCERVLKLPQNITGYYKLIISYS